MSKDQWIADIERICEDFACEQIEREDASGRLVSLGLDRHEAEKMLDEAVA